jgi:hypothetical protein
LVYKGEIQLKNIIAQSLILIGYIVFYIGLFKKNKKNILLTDNISRLFSIAGYIVFESLNSIEHTLYGMLRNYLGQRLIGKTNRVKTITFIIMIIILFTMYGLSFNGISTTMFILSAIINLTTAIFMNEQGIRLGKLFAAICNVIAFVIIGSYSSIIGESLCGIIGVISFITNLKGEQEYDTNTQRV